MASIKLSISLDNNAYDSKNLCFTLNSLKFTSISLFSGYVNTNGALIGKQFCKLKHITVSRLETEVLDSSEYNLVDTRSENPKNFVADDGDFVLESPGFIGDIHKRRVNIWKRFRDGKKLTKSAKQRPEIHTKRVDKSMYVYEKTIVDRVLDKTEVDFESDDFGPELSSQRCNVILKKLEESGDDSKALRLFEWMRTNGKLKQNVIAYNFILRVLSKRNDWRGAERLIQEMVSDSDCEINCQIFNSLIYACNKKGLANLGTKWFRMMILDYKVQPNVATFGMLMSLYQKSGSVEEAEFTFSEMRNSKIICQSAYSSMITIYTRLGLYEKAETVIGFLREDKVVLNLENWLVLLNAFCQQGKLSDAEKVFSAMTTEAGFSPNIVAYNTMITGYGKISSMDRVESLLRSLVKAGLKPDETTYRSLIEGWGRAGNYEQAKLYYTELKRFGFKPNSSNFYTMVSLQAKNEDEGGVVETINDMIVFGCQKSGILGNVLQAYEKANRLGKMSSILEGCSLYDHVLKSQESCTILVTCYVKSCLVDNALKVLKDKCWEDPVFEDNLYHLLICSCKDLGHLESAAKIFTSMPKSGKPNLNIICTMIDIYSSMNLFSEAEKLYIELKVSRVKLDMIAFSIIIRMYAKSGSLKEACKVLDIMDGHKDIMPDVYLLRDMLRIYQRCGSHDKLADLYYKVLKDGKIWDEEMYNCVINCCAGALPVDELSKLFDEMIHRGFAPNAITFNVVLNAYGKSKLFEKARKVFWMAKKRGLIDVISYNTIISAYGKGKYLKNMLAAIKRMEFDGFSVSLEVYNSMLDVYGKEGEMEKFRGVLKRMKDENCTSDRYTYNILINIYGERGWIEEVSDVLMELKGCGIRPDLCSYNTLIKAYGIAGMVENAVDLVREMRGNGVEPDRITYVNLITALKKNDMILEAVKWSLWMKQMGL